MDKKKEFLDYLLEDFKLKEKSLTDQESMVIPNGY